MKRETGVAVRVNLMKSGWGMGARQRQEWLSCNMQAAAPLEVTIKLKLLQICFKVRLFLMSTAVGPCKQWGFQKAYMEQNITSVLSSLVTRSPEKMNGVHFSAHKHSVLSMGQLQ